MFHVFETMQFLFSGDVMNPINKRILVGTCIISVFFLVVFSTIIYDDFHGFIDAYSLTPILIVVSLIAGASIYAFMAEKIEHKNVALKSNVGLILKFLNSDERAIVKKLIDNNGRARQFELSRIDGQTRLRVHRGIKRLLARGLIVVENNGKINDISLSKEIMDSLF